jgi:type I restriction enzyme S subunit
MSFPRHDELKESGVEWLGKVPAHWAIERFKRSTRSCRNGIWGGEATGDITDIKCVRVADFDRDRLVVADSVPTVRSVTASEQKDRILSRGNLLLEKSGGGENQPVGFVVLFDSDEPAVCSNFVAKIELADRMSPSYWRYCHAAAYAIRLNCRSIKQTSGIQNLDQSQYLDEIAPFPPFDEQHAIASFLDRETSKIDTLVSEQRRLVELLKEKRQAVISHAVTKGLDPTVPMKPSGIEWLGDVPEHWEITRFGWVCDFISYGFTNPMPTADDGPYMLTANDIDYGDVKYESARRTSQDAYDTLLTDKCRPVADDLLLTKDGTLGRIAIHDGREACINQSVALLRVAKSRVNPAFACLALQGSLYQGRMIYEAGGTTIKHIYISRLSQMPFAIPSIAEQLIVVDFLNQHLSNFDALIAEANRAITLLQERRTALISAAVTGKIDVRAVVLEGARP